MDVTAAAGSARTQWVCKCSAYAFPHRKHGGQCLAGTFDDPLCNCTAPAAGPLDTEPPEIRISKYCPVHGINPDDY